ncbi:hypothetical protein MKZ38_009084 [Zalerion maritima]|uniref:F-box domain-containing protein n=1 Tax=Zalerion maritima TaxID=339359 RepID=A0AAD5WNQ6_9PEZI|nr:hypothetical protein MKZ38_009084 [Zalerion maritima]
MEAREFNNNQETSVETALVIPPWPSTLGRNNQMLFTSLMLPRPEDHFLRPGLLWKNFKVPRELLEHPRASTRNSAFETRSITNTDMVDQDNAAATLAPAASKTAASSPRPPRASPLRIVLRKTLPCLPPRSPSKSPRRKEPSASAAPTRLDTLPTEIVELVISSSSSPYDIFRLALTSRRFLRLVSGMHDCKTFQTLFWTQVPKPKHGLVIRNLTIWRCVTWDELRGGDGRGSGRGGSRRGNELGGCRKLGIVRMKEGMDLEEHIAGEERARFLRGLGVGESSESGGNEADRNNGSRVARRTWTGRLFSPENRRVVDRKIWFKDEK